MIWCLGAASLYLRKQHKRLATFPSLTHSLPSPLPSPAPNKRLVFFFSFIISTNYSHQMPPQAKPVPPSPPKLHGRHKCQPSNPDEMNKWSKPNNLDPSDSEHPSASRSITTRKKAPCYDFTSTCVEHYFFISIYYLHALLWSFQEHAAFHFWSNMCLPLLFHTCLCLACYMCQTHLLLASYMRTYCI